jgi:hypothetical protein
MMARDLSWQHCCGGGRGSDQWHELRGQFEFRNPIRIYSVECFGPCAPRAQGRCGASLESGGQR